jgi:phospho-N-acetylmuramoyl-pentapeptide-transferase
MLYYLFDWINRKYAPPGFDAFRFITFRSGLVVLTSLIICFWLGPKIINKLRELQIKETVKENGPERHKEKAGTPTMGGLIIHLGILVPVLLWGDLKNLYVWLTILVTVWLGIVGFIDDYLKVVKKLPKGLIARYKLIGQASIGLIVGVILYNSPEFDGIETLTTLPFIKNLNWDYIYWWIYIPVIVFIITATSNAVNLTDGLDGLAIGTVGISALTLTVMAYVSGHIEFSRYLSIIYLRGSGELAVFLSALVGASLGFLWFNAYPAQVFMGDTGSLALGGIIGAVSVMIKKELLLPVFGGVFFIETLSVIIQRLYFKYTKRKYGQGRRVFKMAPLHHHFELLGWAEPKIVIRFYIVAIIFAILSLVTFKIR